MQRSSQLTFDPERTNVIEMVAVQVRVNPEKSPEQSPYRIPEVLRERLPCKLPPGNTETNRGMVCQWLALFDTTRFGWDFASAHVSDMRACAARAYAKVG